MRCVPWGTFGAFAHNDWGIWHVIHPSSESEFAHRHILVGSELMNQSASFLDVLHERILIGDGASGSELLDYVPEGGCVEVLNLTRPDVVADLHRRYVAAGSEVIETNTFAANPLALERCGCAYLCQDVLRAGVAVARSAGEGIYIAGSVGPLGHIEGEPAPVSVQRDVFRLVLDVLLDQSVDLIIFESFADLEELLIGIQTARSLNSQIPIVAQMAFDGHGYVAGRISADTVASRCLLAGANVVGANCGFGAVSVLRAIHGMQSCGTLLSAFINAGIPEKVNGRAVYQATPEYLAARARELVTHGVRLIGGCCGVGPDAIHAIREAVFDQSTVPPAVPAVSFERHDAHRSGEKQWELSSDHNKLGRVLVELDAPTNTDVSAVISAARMARQSGATAVTVPDNPMSSVHMDPLAVAVCIQHQAGVPTVPHLTCRDRNRLALQSSVMAAKALQVAGLLCVTGDPVRTHGEGKATGVFDVNSVGLLHIARQTLEGSEPDTHRDPPLLGAGINPNVRDLSGQTAKLRRKIDAGAQFALTQPVFDLQRARQLWDVLKRERIDIPIYIGVLPLISLRHAEYLHHEVPGIVIPGNVMEQLARYSDPKDQRSVGLDLSMRLVEELSREADGMYLIAPRNRIGWIRPLILIAARCTERAVSRR